MSRIIGLSQTLQSVKSKNDSILYAIVTDNFAEINKLITEANVNSVIDSKNEYTALHYAVKTNNEKIITYLLNMGANPRLKTNTGEDSFDLSLKYQSKHVITHELKDKEETNKELTRNISILEKKIISLNENNKYLVKTVDDGLAKISELKEEVAKSKRKYEVLDESYTKLINKMRK